MRSLRISVLLNVFPDQNKNGDIWLKIFPKTAGPFPYVWILLFFPQYFYNIIHVGTPSVKVLGFLAGVLMLYVFRQMYWLENWSLVIHFLLGICAVGMVASFTDFTMMFFSFLFVLMFGYANQTNQLIAGLAGFVIVNLAVSQFTLGEPLAFISRFDYFLIMFVSLIAPVAIFLYERTKHLHHELNDANERIIALTKAQERHRFARDLHDTLGHTLTLIIMKSELASRIMERDPARAENEVKEVENAAREALSQTRELVSAERRCTLADEVTGATRLLENRKIFVTVHMAEKWPKFRQPDETMIALALREAVTNVVRHSMAKHCRISGKCMDHQLMLEVWDDGIGLPDGKTEGNGLHTISERIQLIGGITEIRSERKGTLIRFTLPFPAAGEEDRS